MNKLIIGSFLVLFVSGSLAGDAGNILKEIQKFESEKDPKCYATASRLEDFMFGTPLASGARFEKNELSKQLVLALWQAAAKTVKKAEISSADIQSVAQDLFSISVNENGHYKLVFSKDKSVVIHKDDLRQYGSVAYSLRSILAAQQTMMMEGDINTPLLTNTAIEELKLRLDLLNLAVLKLADYEARQNSFSEVSKSSIVNLWEDLIAMKKSEQLLDENYDKTLIKKVVAQKVSSYEKYNKVSSKIFVRNLQVFYARQSWPKDPQKAKLFQHYFTEALIQFASALYLGSHHEAKKNNHAVIQESDVYGFSKTFLPHSINEYEDAAFFPKLEAEKKVYLEAYDMDSFRDSGIHWKYLQYALEGRDLSRALTSDPYAMELLTENIAVYGVLILRVAGNLSKERSDSGRLDPQDLVDAINLITQRTKENNESKAIEQVASIYSDSKASTHSKKGSFLDVTTDLGIAFEHRSSDWLNRLLRSYLKKSDGVGNINIPPAFGGAGIASEDIDGDGDTDLLLLSGTGNKLYENDNGKFKDISKLSGLSVMGIPGEPRQPLIADLDNDGDQDIIITYANQSHQLYENIGNGKFNLHDGSPIGGFGLVGGPATVFDANNDGLLDVLITYFGDYPNGVLPTLSRRNENGLPDELWLNQGGLKFTKAKNTGLENIGWGQAVTHTDLNNDGLQDVIIGNDFGVNGYYINDGKTKFKEVSVRLKTDKPSYTMGIGLGDLNNDQKPDVYISNIVTMNKDESYVLPSDDTPMRFNPDKLAEMRVVEANDLFISNSTSYTHSDLVGRGYHSTGWSWGADFFDFDNDTDMDLYVTNGMNEFNLYSSHNPEFTDQYDQAKDVYIPVSEKETNVFFVNENGKLNNHTAGSGLDYLGNSRAASYLDWNGDGKLDVALSNYHGQVRLYENKVKNDNNWISIKLVGSPKAGSNKDAIGARLVLSLENGQKLWREVHGSVAYMTVHPKQQYFGLGGFTSGDLEIRWPNGEIQEVEINKMNRSLTIVQGEK